MPPPALGRSRSTLPIWSCPPTGALENGSEYGCRHPPVHPSGSGHGDALPPSGGAPQPPPHPLRHTWLVPILPRCGWVTVAAFPTEGPATLRRAVPRPHLPSGPPPNPATPTTPLLRVTPGVPPVPVVTVGTRWGQGPIPELPLRALQAVLPSGAAAASRHAGLGGAASAQVPRAPPPRRTCPLAAACRPVTRGACVPPSTPHKGQTARPSAAPPRPPPLVLCIPSWEGSSTTAGRVGPSPLPLACAGEGG